MPRIAVIFFILFAPLATPAAQSSLQLPPEMEIPHAESDEQLVRQYLTLLEQYPWMVRTKNGYTYDPLEILSEAAALQTQLIQNTDYAYEAQRRPKPLEIAIFPSDKASDLAAANERNISRWKARLVRTLQQHPNWSDAILGLLNEIDGEASEKLLSGIIQSLEPEARKDVYTQNGAEAQFHFLEHHAKLTEPQIAGLERARAVRKLESKLKSLLEVAIFLQTEPGRWPTPTEQLDRLENLSVSEIRTKADFAKFAKPRLDEVNRRYKNRAVRIKLLEQLRDETIDELGLVAQKSPEKLDRGIVLDETTMLAKLYRAEAGGDCSTKWSFASVMNVDEYTFFVKSAAGEVKGYVQTTLGSSGGVPTLYVNSINGVKITPDEVDLILQGLYQMRGRLRFRQIAVPNELTLNELVNYERIETRIANYQAKGSLVTFVYQNPQIRRLIESFKSSHNVKDYDSMRANKRVLLIPNSELESRSVRVEASEKVVPRFTTSPKIDPELLVKYSISRDETEFKKTLSTTMKLAIEEDLHGLHDAFLKVWPQMPLREKFEKSFNQKTLSESGKAQDPHKALLLFYLGSLENAGIVNRFFSRQTPSEQVAQVLALEALVRSDTGLHPPELYGTLNQIDWRNHRNVLRDWIKAKGWASSYDFGFLILGTSPRAAAALLSELERQDAEKFRKTVLEDKALAAQLDAFAKNLEFEKSATAALKSASWERFLLWSAKKNLQLYRHLTSKRTLAENLGLIDALMDVARRNPREDDLREHAAKAINGFDWLHNEDLLRAWVEKDGLSNIIRVVVGETIKRANAGALLTALIRTNPPAFYAEVRHQIENQEIPMRVWNVVPEQDREKLKAFRDYGHYLFLIALADSGAHELYRNLIAQFSDARLDEFLGFVELHVNLSRRELVFSSQPGVAAIASIDWTDRMDLFRNFMKRVEPSYLASSAVLASSQKWPSDILTFTENETTRAWRPRLVPLADYYAKRGQYGRTAQQWVRAQWNDLKLSMTNILTSARPRQLRCKEVFESP